MKLTEAELESIPQQFAYNAIKTPDGTLLHSKHGYDYVCHRDDNGELYVLDGGNGYRRCSVNKEPWVDMSVSMCEDIENIREYFTWGTYGKQGDQPRRDLLLKDMSNEHIENIVSDGHIMTPIMESELQFRKSRGILVED